MRCRPSPCADSAGARQTLSFSVASLECAVQAWLFDGESRQLSPRTMQARQEHADRLLWFLRRQDREEHGPTDLRAFLSYLATGHREKEGRWGNPCHKGLSPVKASTVWTYHRDLRILFGFAVAEGFLASNPVESIKPPVVRQDQILPLDSAQVQALVRQARDGEHPPRDEAVIAFLVDTGVRASEACAIRIRDVNVKGRSCSVLGKGNKRRTVFFGATTGKVLLRYLATRRHADPDAFLFVGEGGRTPGKPLTPNGLTHIIRDLGRSAEIQGVRCSAHTLRHTFAVSFLRHGGNVFSLRELLGHSSLSMTQRYVALAQADMAEQHRQYSPMDNLRP